MSGAVLAEQPPIRVKQGRHGLFMYNMNDKYIGGSLDHYGEFSELESTLFDQILKPGMTVLDIGANIGAHTVSMAKTVGVEGLVIAIEPQRVVFQMLCGNLALNGLTNVQAFLVALGKEAGTITVPPVSYDQAGNFGGVELVAEGAGEIVPMLTVDSFNLERCDFMKIDVEGMELPVLEGAVQTLERCHPVLYVENDRREKSLPLITFLLSIGYRLYWHLPPLYNPNNYFGNVENIFSTLVSANMLCLPRGFQAEMSYFVEITAENAAQHMDNLRGKA